MGAIIQNYWQGADRALGYSKAKLLIIGESHYAENPGDVRADLTDFVVRAHIEQGNFPFFRAIERIITGNRLLDAAERDAFWRLVSFANFVQEVVLQNHRPTPQQFSASGNRMKQIVEVEKPDLVCFFSALSWRWRPWGKAPWGQAFGHEPCHVDDSDEITDYATDWGDRVTMARFNHPSRPGAPYDVWHVWFDHVLGLARDRARPLGRSGL